MTTVNRENIKVLIADDEIEFASTLATRLQLRKFNTTMAESGGAALSAIEKSPPDVLLLDLKMPDIDGLEVLARLKDDFADIKVIILTGHGSFEAGQEGMKLGAYDYVMKPVDLNRLIEKIEGAYKEKQAG
ncbi:MAG: response regulator [Desulfocapsaceae bacterium]|jgi:DNA-binding NtrC family response regulator|nr:response regulator [Desulfocapsaceae bacterium]